MYFKIVKSDKGLEYHVGKTPDALKMSKTLRYPDAVNEGTVEQIYNAIDRWYEEIALHEMKPV